MIFSKELYKVIPEKNNDCPNNKNIKEAHPPEEPCMDNFMAVWKHHHALHNNLGPIKSPLLSD
jgi:hypothetical protein